MFTISPTSILATALSKPIIICPAPHTNSRGSPLPYEESNTVTVRYIGNPDANGYVSDAANNYIRDGQTFSISAGESHSFTVHTDPGYYAFKVWTEGATSSRSHGAVYNGSSFSVVNPSENKILYVRFENARYYPPTGDESNLGLFAALALMSVLGFAAVVTVKKHEH